MDQNEPVQAEFQDQIEYPVYNPNIVDTKYVYPPSEFDPEEYKNATIDYQKRLTEKVLGKPLESKDPVMFAHFEEKFIPNRSEGLFSQGIGCSLWKQGEKYVLTSTFGEYDLVAEIVPGTNSRNTILLTHTGTERDGYRSGFIEFWSAGRSQNLIKDLEKWMDVYKGQDREEKKKIYEDIVSCNVGGEKPNPNWINRVDTRNPLVYLSFYAFKSYSQQPTVNGQTLKKYLVV